MIVSILQLMGFSLGKPVNSRASETVQKKQSKAGVEGISSTSCGTVADTKHASASELDAKKTPTRRPIVKAQSAKAKVEPPVIPAVVRPKPAGKSTAKTVVKVTAVAKSALAAGVRAGTRAQVVSPVKKAPPVKPSPKTTPRDVEIRPMAKVKDKVKDSVKMITAKAGKSEAVSKPKVTHSVTPGTIAKAAGLSAKAAPEPTPVAAASTPARAGRPSSRLAQLTVPSMAQSVASTAAKASFTQTQSLPLIVPPLASAVKKDPKLANNWKLKPVDQLTDADLIAMPDDEYMNDTQMAYFRLKLTKLKQDILSNAGETTEHLREDTVVVPDPADRATIEEEHALELRTRDRERKLLKKIEQSIQRIDAGDYGYCDETGESIGVGRLLARPTANLSLEAQQRRELKQKMFGD